MPDHPRLRCLLPPSRSSFVEGTRDPSQVTVDVPPLTAEVGMGTSKDVLTTIREPS